MVELECGSLASAMQVRLDGHYGPSGRGMYAVNERRAVKPSASNFVCGNVLEHLMKYQVE